MEKKYSNENITITWKPSLCIHSANCWKGLHSVFKPKERPWINMSGAPDDEIIAQVNKCPTQAISFNYNNDIQEKNEFSDILTDIKQEKPKVLVDVLKNGPIIVKGHFNLHLADGSKSEKESIALCRCGYSKNKPHCDGSHKAENWQDNN